jgi:hypothetical protein
VAWARRWPAEHIWKLRKAAEHGLQPAAPDSTMRRRG